MSILSIRLLRRPIGVHQVFRTNHSPNIYRSSGYDDIRLSQMIRNSNICEKSWYTSSRKRRQSNSIKTRHLLPVIYDNYYDDEEDYSRLLLRKKQSACISKKPHSFGGWRVCFPAIRYHRTKTAPCHPKTPIAAFDINYPTFYLSGFPVCGTMFVRE